MENSCHYLPATHLPVSCRSPKPCNCAGSIVRTAAIRCNRAARNRGPAPGATQASTFSTPSCSSPEFSSARPSGRSRWQTRQNLPRYRPRRSHRPKRWPPLDRHYQNVLKYYRRCARFDERLPLSYRSAGRRLSNTNETSLKRWGILRWRISACRMELVWRLAGLCWRCRLRWC